MSRVIANERLVVRQKLTALYQDKLADASAKTGILVHQPARRPRQNKSGGKSLFVFPASHSGRQLSRRRVVERRRVGPSIRRRLASWAMICPRATRWPARGTKNSPTNTIPPRRQLYDQLHQRTTIRIWRSQAMTGKSRCLSRLGQLNAAIAQCQPAAFPASAIDTNPAVRLAIENARLLLLSLLEQAGPSPQNSGIFNRTIAALIGDLYNPAGDRALLPPNQNLFIAGKVLGRAARSVSSLMTTKTKEQLRKTRHRGSAFPFRRRNSSALSQRASTASLKLCSTRSRFIACVTGFSRQRCWCSCPTRAWPRFWPATRTLSKARSPLTGY